MSPVSRDIQRLGDIAAELIERAAELTAAVPGSADVARVLAIAYGDASALYRMGGCELTDMAYLNQLATSAHADFIDQSAAPKRVLQ